MAPTSTRSRPVGRPRSTGGRRGKVRRQLVATASRLFSERGYRATSVRAIAAEAGVTPAMVGYYFGDKVGLLEAVLDSVFARLLGEIEDLASRDDDGLTAERLIEIYVRALAAEPWIPHFLVREVLSENTPVRRRFVDHFAGRAAAVVPSFFNQQIEAGKLRRDLDPKLAVLSLVGMCLFPLIAQPVIGPVLGYELDDAFKERLIAHTQKLYLQGVRP